MDSDRGHQRRLRVRRGQAAGHISQGEYHLKLKIEHSVQNAFRLAIKSQTTPSINFLMKVNLTLTGNSQDIILFLL